MAALCLGGWLVCVPAWTAVPPKAMWSSSGQFVVALTELPRMARPEGLVMVEPGTLLLTCERVRQALATELPMVNAWQGRVYLAVHPGLTNNHPPVIGAQRFTQGWQYQIELPPAIEPHKLVRGLVQVLLLEVANRQAPPRSAEIPLWLSEGLTQHLLHAALVDLVVEPAAMGYQRRQAVQGLRPDPLEASRSRLRTHAALSFGKMAEITGEQVAEETWKTFQASTHVFLGYLLQTPQARAALEDLLARLPYHLNWQTPFFEVFAPMFPRLVDVEKWWSVVLVDFTGLDPLNAWSRELALQKLDEALRPPVLVPDRTDRLPRRRRVTIQQILSEWDSTSQRLLLRAVVAELTAIRVKMPPELGELTEAYREAISRHLARREDLGRARARIGLPDADSARLIRSTAATLDELDRRRAAEGGVVAPAETPDAPPAATGPESLKVPSGNR